MTLRVTDDDGFTATDSRVITVSKADGGDDGGGGIPAPSLAASVVTVAVIALRRRRSAGRLGSQRKPVKMKTWFIMPDLVFVKDRL